jgi:hypothetical protein
MGSLFLTTVLSCRQLLGIVNRVVNNSILTTQQKTEIVLELRKLVPSCPLIIKNYDTKTTPSN